MVYSDIVSAPGGGDDVLGGVAGGAEHHVRVAGQLLHYLLGLQVPDVHLGGRGQARLGVAKKKGGKTKTKNKGPKNRTWLSSLPDTIHLPPVTEKLANTQYFSFLWPE